MGTAKPLVQVALGEERLRPGSSPGQQTSPSKLFDESPIRDPGQQTPLYSTPTQTVCANANWRLPWASRIRADIEKRMVRGLIEMERLWQGLSASLKTKKID
jgi:hypothetical protein